MERQAELKRDILVDREDDAGYDAIVVGSGYGGSVTACRMSEAGIKVCLLEKGRRWNAEDFPTNGFQMISAAKYENRNLGIRFGPQKALFQVHEQNNCLALVVSGLGGGSLVNAGVMLTTPPRTRRNPKWPKEWERDWDACQATAKKMLRIQSMPVKFPAAKVMEEVLEGEFELNSDSSMMATVNFDLEETPSNSSKHHQMGSCVACGNCVSGCPYNAKNSTDKNYLLSAIQAGCAVRTECQVRCVVANPNEKGRRWKVYLNEIDYITSDFVILSAGVLGTTEILFQSQIRGLKLSEALGSGFSTNGNMVAYVGGSSAPLNGYGLSKQLLPSIPFQDRPGPSISSSHTSSLGFTIQSSILPTAYPYLLIALNLNYKWPIGDWSFRGIINHLKNVFALKINQSIIINVIGYDEGNGKITFDKGSDKICFDPPHDHLLQKKVSAFQKLTKKVGGILYLFRFRTTAVHLLGGCIASSDSSGGVCNHGGQVFDTKTPTSIHAGLYVCDASIIPCSVGVNPSLTITTAAEHISKHLVEDILEYKSKNANLNLGLVTGKELDTENKSTVMIEETMRGYVGGLPCTAHLKMKIQLPNHKDLGEAHPHDLKGKVGGYVVFGAIEKDKLHIIDGEVDLCAVDCRTPYTQYMHYRLLLAASSGSRYILEGKKIMNPYLIALYAWKETTTLYVTFSKVDACGSPDTTVNLTGELRVSFVELLKCLVKLRGNKGWRFISLLLQTLSRTYISRIPRGNPKHFISSDACYKAYPSSTLHNIRTGDGFSIGFRQWRSTRNLLLHKGEKQLYPVLLLGGYTIESYCLPTEPHDLVRTLLEEGHDVWLMQHRLHPLNTSNSATIEDIGRHDIPAAICKILEVHGPRAKIHVVAHCAGGLATHIAIMGGHVSATNIASLSCTNSSMFFKLTMLNKIKMWIPLVPISMAVLGKNKILPILEKSETSTRHLILKWIAPWIPRYERCTRKECEVQSGIFGNPFWHGNISPTMHKWLIEESVTSIPMSAFPHLRKICNSGYIVDTNGNSSYLTHPERMMMPTLYISGGRTILATPETSFLANKYMKLHQPGFRHERVVVDGFGHSDLLIGEKSHEKVFPHILSHISMAEQERNDAKSNTRKTSSKASLKWGDDPYKDHGEFGYWLFSLCIILFFLFFLFVLF